MSDPTLSETYGFMDGVLDFMRGYTNVSKGSAEDSALQVVVAYELAEFASRISSFMDSAKKAETVRKDGGLTEEKFKAMFSDDA